MISNKLYVGNLYLKASRDQLKQLFGRYGEVKNVDLIDGTGFGYVEMSSSAEAEQAKQALDGSEFLERVIRVK